jgi:hypothetical protein
LARALAHREAVRLNENHSHLEKLNENHSHLEKLNENHSHLQENNPTFDIGIIMWYNYVVVMCFGRAAQTVVKKPH